MSRKRVTSARRVKRRPLSKTDTLKQEEESLTGSRKGKLTPNLKLYYTKLVLGATSGFTAGILGFTGSQGLFFGIIVLLMSYWIIRYVVGITEEEIETGKIFLKGSVTFFIIFTLVWTLLIQLIHGVPFEKAYTWHISKLLGI
ncbi:MAG: hypothetical protein ACFFCQ_05795 [Promethearchaeota archaeon]